MFNLTKEERLVLIFFVLIIILVGTLIHWALKINGRLKDFVNIIESDRLYSRIDIIYGDLRRLCQNSLPGVCQGKTHHRLPDPKRPF